MSNLSSQEPSMKWHQFLIYFALWASAVMAVLNGARLLTGSHYGSEEVTKQVYTYYEGLKSADTFFGVLLMGLAAYLIYTRFQLAGFKKGAPQKLLIAYGLNLALNVGYILTVSNVTKLSMSELMDSSTSSGIVISIAMLIANYLYYQKRAHLFGEDHPEARTDQPGTAAPTAPTADQPAPAYMAKDRFCTHCGKKADPEDQFCTGCGTRLG